MSHVVKSGWCDHFQVDRDKQSVAVILGKRSRRYLKFSSISQQNLHEVKIRNAIGLLHSLVTLTWFRIDTVTHSVRIQGKICTLRPEFFSFFYDSQSSVSSSFWKKKQKI